MVSVKPYTYTTSSNNTLPNRSNPMTILEIPQEIYTSDKACGEYILALNERKSKLAELDKIITENLNTAKEIMLDRLEATGMKHMAFENLGTFKKTTKTYVSFPTAENGGKEAAVEWLTLALERGVITPAQLLDLQQARIVSEPALAIEETVEEYNRQQAINGAVDKLMPPSPFNHFTQSTLSTPRTRKV